MSKMKINDKFEIVINFLGRCAKSVFLRLLAVSFWLLFVTIYFGLINENNSVIQKSLVLSMTLIIYLFTTILSDKSRRIKLLFTKFRYLNDMFSSLIFMVFYVNIMLLLGAENTLFSEIISILVVIILAYTPLVLNKYNLIKSKYSHRNQLYYMILGMILYNIYAIYYSTINNLPNYDFEVIGLAFSSILIIDTIVNRYISGITYRGNTDDNVVKSECWRENDSINSELQMIFISPS